MADDAYAPELIPALQGLTGFAAAAATAAIGIVASVVATTLVNTVFPAPSAKVGGCAPTAALPKISSGLGLKEEAFILSDDSMASVREPWWRDDEWPWRRFCVWRTFGDCMAPIYSGEHWAVVDRRATIRAGDLIVFGVNDLDQYLRTASLPLDATGLTKRFMGVEDATASAIVECLKPPMRIRVPLARLTYAHRIVGLAKTPAEARRLAHAR